MHSNTTQMIQLYGK